VRAVGIGRGRRAELRQQMTAERIIGKNSVEIGAADEAVFRACTFPSAGGMKQRTCEGGAFAYAEMHFVAGDFGAFVRSLPRGRGFFGG